VKISFIIYDSRRKKWLMAYLSHNMIAVCSAVNSLQKWLTLYNVKYKITAQLIWKPILKHFVWISFFPIKQSPLGPWFRDRSRFSHVCLFVEKIDSKIAKILSRNVNDTRGSNFSPLIFTFSFTYVILAMVFPKGMGDNTCFCEWSRSVIKDPAVSFTLGYLIRGLIDTVGSNPLKSLTPCDLILRCHWYCWIRFFCLVETT
jgi:hypothetical protein